MSCRHVLTHTCGSNGDCGIFELAYGLLTVHFVAAAAAHLVITFLTECSKKKILLKLDFCLPGGADSRF